MSQYGAKGAADAGLSYSKILDFYYPGTVSSKKSGQVRVELRAYKPYKPSQVVVAPDGASGALTISDDGPRKVSATETGGLFAVETRAGHFYMQRSTDGGATWVDYPINGDAHSSGPVVFTSPTNALNVVGPGGSTKYRGQIRVVPISPTEVRAVNVVDMEQYLWSVVKQEVPATWPAAAVRAQAVAARSYAYSVLGTYPYWDICDTTACQDYRGMANEHSLSTAAVNDTAGEVRTYGGQVAFTQYASSNGGWTVAVAGRPYLVAKADPYDVAAAPANLKPWTKNVAVSTIEAGYPQIGSLTSLTVNSRTGNGDWGGYTTSITISGTSGSATVSGDAFKNKLGLNSAWWTLDGGITESSFGSLDDVTAIPGGLKISGWAQDPQSSSPAAVHLYVNGKLTTAVTANQSNSGFSASLPLPTGTYSVCAYVITLDKKNPQLGCGSATTYSGDPVGALQVQAAPGGVRIVGWALDPDTVAPAAVQLTMDGKAAGTLSANGASDSVDARYLPVYGSARGFSTVLSATSGSHQVCATVANVGPGSSKQLGCGTVNVLAGTPIGRLDGVRSVPGGAYLWGWAIDPDTTASIPVHVYVDGKLVAGFAADQGRPDVANAYPVYGAMHGYSATLPLTAGKHTICAWALNIAGAGGNPQLGCQTVTVMAGDPFGTLDGAAVEAAGTRIWGWAIDPDTTAPVPVHVYVDGQLVLGAPANQSRPDVASVYPAYGPNHGYFTVVPMGPGTHTVCAFALNIAGSGTNKQLGACKTVRK
jgi:SpoIID/LytB domain protein